MVVTNMPIRSSLASLAAYSADPWQPQNRYFSRAEADMEALWNRLIFPFIEGADFTTTIDLAAGQGRNTECLLRYATKVIIVEYQQGNVEFCRKRFAGRDNVQFFANNGFDLQPITDGSVTFVYCFDAMVHFDSDVVRSYLKDIFRVLQPNGTAFLHHSNYTQGGGDWVKNPGSRNFMSRELFAHYARKEGLVVLKQQTIDWALQNIDCLSLVKRE